MFKNCKMQCTIILPLVILLSMQLNCYSAAELKHTEKLLPVPNTSIFESVKAKQKPVVQTDFTDIEFNNANETPDTEMSKKHISKKKQSIAPTILMEYIDSEEIVKDAHALNATKDKNHAETHKQFNSKELFVNTAAENKSTHDLLAHKKSNDLNELILPLNTSNTELPTAKNYTPSAAQTLVSSSNATGFAQPLNLTAITTATENVNTNVLPVEVHKNVTTTTIVESKSSPVNNTNLQSHTKDKDMQTAGAIDTKIPLSTPTLFTATPNNLSTAHLKPSTGTKAPLNNNFALSKQPSKSSSVPLTLASIPTSTSSKDPSHNTEAAPNIEVQPTPTSTQQSNDINQLLSQLDHLTVKQEKLSSREKKLTALKRKQAAKIKQQAAKNKKLKAHKKKKQQHHKKG